MEMQAKQSYAGGDSDAEKSINKPQVQYGAYHMKHSSFAKRGEGQTALDRLSSRLDNIFGQLNGQPRFSDLLTSSLMPSIGDLLTGPGLGLLEDCLSGPRSSRTYPPSRESSHPTPRIYNIG